MSKKYYEDYDGDIWVFENRKSVYLHVRHSSEDDESGPFNNNNHWDIEVAITRWNLTEITEKEAFIRCL